MLNDIWHMTGVEWAVFALATAVCLLGSLLPKLGNLLGRLFLGEDPLLARWKQARAERRERVRAKVQLKLEQRRQKKAQGSAALQPRAPRPE